ASAAGPFATPWRAGGFIFHPAVFSPPHTLDRWSLRGETRFSLFHAWIHPTRRGIPVRERRRHDRWDGSILLSWRLDRSGRRQGKRGTRVGRNGIGLGAPVVGGAGAVHHGRNRNCPGFAPGRGD